MPPLADTITPLLAASFIYLFVLNLLIGVLEGKLLKRWFAGGLRAVWWMIGANYVSAWLGWFALSWLVDRRIDKALLGPRPIERINWLAVVVVLIAFAITIVVEVGFVHLARQRTGRTPGRTLLATLSVNLVSYVIVCLLFLMTSFSLPFNARVRPLADLGSLPPGTLYWVDPGGRVISRRTDHAGADCIVGKVKQNAYVTPCQLRIDLSENRQRAVMNATYSTRGYADPPPPGTLNLPDPLILADAGPASAFPADYWDQTRTLLKNVLDLRPAERRKTRVTFDQYRLYLDTDVPDGPHSHLTIGLAALEWDIHEPTVLPDDKVVFQWAGQIVLFDPHSRKLAFIALGTCPAFVPEAKQIGPR